MTRYIIFEERTDDKGQSYIISMGTVKANDIEHAKRLLRDEFDTYVDSSYKGGKIIISSKSSFTKLGRVSSRGWANIVEV